MQAKCGFVQLKEPLKMLEARLVSQSQSIENWFDSEWSQHRPPIYCSVDLRNAGYKIAPVDTNLFPAGFNNLNLEHMDDYANAAQNAINDVCPKVKRLLIIAESHTRNLFYLESVSVLQQIFNKAGFEVRVGSLIETVKEETLIDLPSGRQLLLEPLIRKEDQVGVKDFFSCCIILNNDLAAGIPPILQNLSQMFLPPIDLGWFKRLKSEHFNYYEKVISDFAQQFDFDPWLLMPYFDRCPDVNFMKMEGEKCLFEHAKGLFEKIKRKYQEYGIKQDPFLVVKADQGTYGMAIMMIKKPEELLNLNRKQRTKMSVTKGGIEVTKAIIQEGVYTDEKVNDHVAEPVIYMIGRQAVGGFYRVHKNKNSDENLNAPGMNFHPLCFKDPLEVPFLYKLVARLALDAAAVELSIFEKAESQYG